MATVSPARTPAALIAAARRLARSSNSRHVRTRVPWTSAGSSGYASAIASHVVAKCSFISGNRRIAEVAGGQQVASLVEVGGRALQHEITVRQDVRTIGEFQRQVDML